MGKRRLLYIITICIMIIHLTACGSSDLYKSGKEGYSEITTIDGVKFDIVSSIARNATAVTNISEQMEFEANQVYVYKDGESAYFLFKMDAIVCVAEKGTSFGFMETEDKFTALKNSDVLGVWFKSPEKKKLKYDEKKTGEAYKLIATVTAEVTLTSELYSDFAGKLAVIDDGTTEWSFFIGSIGSDFEELNKDEKELIEYMAQSFMLHKKPQSTELQQNDPVSVGGTEETNEAETMIMETEVFVQEESETEEMSEMNESMTEISEENTAEEYATTELEIIEIEETTESQEVTTEEIKTTEEENEDTIIDIEEHKGEAQKEHTSIILNNQKNTVKEDGKIYYSNIYDMLPLNKFGYASVQTSSGFENAVVKVDAVYKGQEAVRIIKDGYAKENLRYFESQEGTSWHVAHYTVDYSSCSEKGYLNIKLRGMDGENLRFRGIRYSQRTYVIPVSEEEYYCFYEVPNGCKEYVLECGDGTVERTDAIAAYYMYRE
ncbi:MAG: hypothetical protein UHN47_03850 [Lachnospiraceae bacterium]|nr:hypothetical protein [Lachnospiraceae bacterium]